MDEMNDLTAEVQELAWALVDEHATDAQISHLEELLLENEDARKIYVMCMQMHADLHYLLGDKRPRSHIALEKAMREKEEPSKAASAAPLPVVDLPPISSSSPLPNECF